MTTSPAEPPESTLAAAIAAIWRDHSNCNWLSNGVNVVWSCGIIHGLSGGGRPWPIHMQPTTRDTHVAALVMTQVEADRAIAAQDTAARIAQLEADLAAAEAKLAAVEARLRAGGGIGCPPAP